MNNIKVSLVICRVHATLRRVRTAAMNGIKIAQMMGVFESSVMRTIQSNLYSRRG